MCSLLWIFSFLTSINWCPLHLSSAIWIQIGYPDNSLCSLCLVLARFEFFLGWPLDQVVQLWSIRPRSHSALGASSRGTDQLNWCLHAADLTLGKCVSLSRSSSFWFLVHFCAVLAKAVIVQSDLSTYTMVVLQSIRPTRHWTLIQLWNLYTTEGSSHAWFSCKVVCDSIGHVFFFLEGAMRVVIVWCASMSVYWTDRVILGQTSTNFS